MEIQSDAPSAYMYMSVTVFFGSQTYSTLKSEKTVHKTKDGSQNKRMCTNY